jgi:N-acetylmuramate 1-kinase
MQKPDSEIPDDSREALRARFLEGAGITHAHIIPLAPDASFRRYFRILGAGRQLMLMDAPPPMEDTRPFIRIDEHLRAMGLLAPNIVARNTEQGLLLLEDFGDDTLARLLAQGDAADPLYRLAIDTLVELQCHPDALNVEAAPYDLDALLNEAALLPDWHYPLIHGETIATAERASYLAIWSDVIDSLPPPAVTLVLRDFHVDNLMRVYRDGIERCAVLDFQDAVIGPMAYDLASLLEDARRDIDPAFATACIEYYLERMPLLQRDNFLSWFKVLAAQRHAKVLGIFSRLYLRDGKSNYLQHLPRVIRLLQKGLDAPGLEPLGAWLEKHFPKRLAYAP